MLRLKRWQYDEMKEQQDGCCAICHQPPKGNRRLAVDHCHANYFVRGLLCHRCNMALGQLGSLEVLGEALNYLRRAEEFSSRRKAGLHFVGYSLPDFLKKRFRKQDWRLCRDPYDRERLLDYEVEKRWVAGKAPKEIGKELGISASYVERLNEGKFRYSAPLYYGSHDILWPKRKPSDSLRKKWSHSQRNPGK